MTESTGELAVRLAAKVVDDWDNDANCPDDNVVCGMDCLKKRVAMAIESVESSTAQACYEKAAQAVCPLCRAGCYPFDDDTKTTHRVGTDVAHQYTVEHCIGAPARALAGGREAMERHDAEVIQKTLDMTAAYCQAYAKWVFQHDVIETKRPELPTVAEVQAELSKEASHP